MFETWGPYDTAPTWPWAPTPQPAPVPTWPWAPTPQPAPVPRAARTAYHQTYEWTCIRQAIGAMQGLGVPPGRVRSRKGMLRLVGAVVGSSAPARSAPARVRWSWPAPALARAHRARPLFI